MGAAAESVSLEKDPDHRAHETTGAQAEIVSAAGGFAPSIERLFHSSPAHPSHSTIRSLSTAGLRVPTLQRAQRTYGNRASQQMIMRALILQRHCTCGGTCEKCQAEQPAEDEKQEPVQRKASAHNSEEFNGIPESTGERLDAGVSTQLETYFATDLDGVHVHTGPEAAKSAKSLDALAYTAGRDIYFAAGMYAPASREGQRLLAHEVAHVIQQSSGKEPSIATKSSHGAKIGAPDDVLETEADRAAQQFISGEQPTELTDEEQRRRREAPAQQRFIQRQPLNSIDRSGPVLQLQPDSGTTTPAGSSSPAPLQSQAPAATPGQPIPLPAGLPPEVVRKIAFANSVMSRVKPLTKAEIDRIDAIVGGTPVYNLIKEQEKNKNELAERKQWLADWQARKARVDAGETLAGGVAPTQKELDILSEEVELLSKDIESLDNKIAADLKPLGITKEQLLDQIEREFPEIWIRRAKQIANTLLDTHRDAIKKEQARYPANASSINIEGLRKADESLKALADQRDEKARRITQVEQERRQIELDLQSAQEKVRATKEEGSLPGGVAPSEAELEQMRARQGALDQELPRLNGELSDMERNLGLQRERMADAYPILHVKDYQPGSLYQLSNEDLTQLTGSWTQNLLDNIETTRDNIESGKLLVWQLNDIPEMTYQSLGIPRDSVLGEAVRHYTAGKESEEAAWALARVVFEVGVTILVSALATPAAGAAVGAVFTAGHLVEDVAKYRTESAAANVALDPEWSRLVADPTVAWILLDLAALGLDAFMIAKALAPAARTMAASGEIGEFAAQARRVAPEAAEQLTATARRRLGLKAIEEGLESGEAEGRTIAKAVTSDGLHEIRAFEDGTLGRCSAFCTRLRAFFKELLDKPEYRDLADQLRDIELRTRSQIPGVREAAVKQAAELEPVLRRNASTIVADELKLNPKAVEALLELYPMRRLRGDPELVKFLSERPPELIEKFGRAIRLSDNVGKRMIVESLLESNQLGKISTADFAKALNDLTAFLEQYPGRLRGDLASRYFRALAADAPQAKAELDLAKDILEGKTPFGQVKALEGVPEAEVQGAKVPDFRVSGEGQVQAAELKTLGIPGGVPQAISPDAVQRNLRSAISQIRAAGEQAGRDGFIRLDGRAALRSALSTEEVVNAVKGQLKSSDAYSVVRWVEVLYTDATGKSQRILLERVGQTMIRSNL